MTDQFEMQRFARDFARRLAKLERSQRRTAASPNTLNHAAIDGGELVVKDDQGNTKYHLGTDPVTGITAPKFEPGPVPATPEAPELEAREGAVQVVLSGLDVDEQPAPEDLRHVEIHMSLTEGFEVTPGTMVTSTTNPADGVSVSKASGVWWVRVVWVTLSGQRSEPSDAVSVDIVPPVDAQDIQDTLDTAQARLDEYRDEVAAPRFQALEEGFVVHETNISDARDRLEAAEQTLSPLPGRVESAEQDVAAAQVEATKAAAAAVEANNRAMTRLANGNFESDLLYWDHDNVELTSTAHSGQQAAQITGWLRPGSSFPVVPDQIWELSLYYQHDVTVEFQAIDGDTRTTLSTHHLDGDSTWSDSGALRITIPADVHMLSFTITGTSAIVDDITLRDVTDVVRLEEAANANRQKAEQAISELAVLQLAVDGEGGLKDSLASAETVLETKADESALDQLDQKLAGDLAAFEAHYTRVWRQPTPPPAGTHYAWLGERNASASVRLDGDGNETARNLAPDPIPFSVDSFSSTRNEPSILAGGGIRLTASGDAGQVRLDSRHNIPITPGQWAAVMVDIRSLDGYAGYLAIMGYNGSTYTGFFPSTSNYGGAEWNRMQLTFRVPDNVDSLNIRPRFVSQVVPAGETLDFRHFHIASADSESAALAQVQTYFDGSTASDRAHDLWYNQDGVPHEWVNGTNGEPGGWVELSDDRINQLQTDVIEAAETAYLDRLVVRDEIITPETITNKLWADLGVFNRLQAREGWIGGTLLADGAITADKITATREMVTKIMGAEWAYIAEQLIVDGSILTRDLEALSAAIQSLTVTQRADIAELWAEELWTALAVIEELQAEEAWITSAMISELTAEKVTVTENFVGRVAELLHLVVDRIDVNSLWADQTWQAAGHFGSETGGYQTQVNGQGLSIWRQVEGEQQLATRLGPGENALSFFDEDTGQLTGSLSQDGSANLTETSVQSLTVAGRDLTHAPHEYQPGVPLLDSLPRGVWVAGPVDMAGVSVDRNRYGFLELTADVVEGRVYRLSTSNFLMAPDSQYYGSFRYTLTENGNQVPTVNSPILGNGEWIISTTGARFVQEGGRTLFVAPQTGVLKILLTIRLAGTNSGITFNSGDLVKPELWLEDLGTNKNTVYRRRFSATGGPDPDFLDDTPGASTYQTEWEATWREAYRNNGNTRRTNENYGLSLPQGVNPRWPNEGWTSLAGFGGATTSTNGQEVGKTFANALSGAEIQSVKIITTGGGSLGTDSRFFQRLHWAEHSTPPATYIRNSGRHMGGGRVDPGWTKEFEVAEQYWPLLQTGDWKSIGLVSYAYNDSINDGWLAWGNQRPRIRVTYQR